MGGKGRASAKQRKHASPYHQHHAIRKQSSRAQACCCWLELLKCDELVLFVPRQIVQHTQHQQTCLFNQHILFYDLFDLLSINLCVGCAQLHGAGKGRAARRFLPQSRAHSTHAHSSTLNTQSTQGETKKIRSKHRWMLLSLLLSPLVIPLLPSLSLLLLQVSLHTHDSLGT